MKRKGQAAIEFLSTYGWMFLVVVAVIGVMSYYGFGDAKSKIPTTCYFGTNFDCGAFMVSDDGDIAFEITNFNNRPINFTSIAVLFPGEEEYISNSSFSSTVVPVGETSLIFINETSRELAGKDKFLIKLFYQYDEVDALDKVASGEIVADVTSDDIIVEQYLDEANSDGLVVSLP
ncbi:MAG: hypothetical protein ACOCQQ_02165 [Candidatus Nanoarchaeia archaeon]